MPPPNGVGEGGSSATGGAMLTSTLPDRWTRIWCWREAAASLTTPRREAAGRRGGALVGGNFSCCSCLSMSAWLRASWSTSFPSSSWRWASISRSQLFNRTWFNPFQNYISTPRLPFIGLYVPCTGGNLFKTLPIFMHRTFQFTFQQRGGGRRGRRRGGRPARLGDPPPSQHATPRY